MLRNMIELVTVSMLKSICQFKDVNEWSNDTENKKNTLVGKEGVVIRAKGRSKTSTVHVGEDGDVVYCKVNIFLQLIHKW